MRDRKLGPNEDESLRDSAEPGRFSITPSDLFGWVLLFLVGWALYVAISFCVNKVQDIFSSAARLAPIVSINPAGALSNAKGAALDHSKKLLNKGTERVQEVSKASFWQRLLYTINSWFKRSLPPLPRSPEALKQF